MSHRDNSKNSLQTINHNPDVLYFLGIIPYLCFYKYVGMIYIVNNHTKYNINLINILLNSILIRIVHQSFFNPPRQRIPDELALFNANTSLTTKMSKTI